MGSTIFWVLVGVLVLYTIWCWIKARFFPDNFDKLKAQADKVFSRDFKDEKPRDEEPKQKTGHPGYTADSEPTPIFGTKVTVRQAVTRARRHVADSLAARTNHDYQLAEELVRKALDEIGSDLKQDHWYTPEILNTLGCVLFDQGRNAEARAMWEEAFQIALEWQEQCHYLMPTLENNLDLVKRRMGF